MSGIIIRPPPGSRASPASAASISAALWTGAATSLHRQRWRKRLERTQKSRR
jgi:hypothetical protein